jgi:hypothetical protein
MSYRLSAIVADCTSFLDSHVCELIYVDDVVAA